MVAVRVVLITLLVTAFCFAVSLFLGIAGIVLVSMIRGGNSDLSLAYRHIAFPVAMGAMAIAFVLTLVTEIKHYRRRKAEYVEWRKAA
jgi:TRAP-type C4-dicarboxylate transport system permease small subunit